MFLFSQICIFNRPLFFLAHLMPCGTSAPLHWILPRLLLTGKKRQSTSKYLCYLSFQLATFIWLASKKKCPTGKANKKCNTLRSIRFCAKFLIFIHWTANVQARQPLKKNAYTNHQFFPVLYFYTVLQSITLYFYSSILQNWGLPDNFFPVSESSCMKETGKPDKNTCSTSTMWNTSWMLCNNPD